MPVQLASFLLPRNGNTWFILEDKYLKGGLQVAANAATRDAINSINLKSGQLVITQDDHRLWQLQDDLVTWIEFVSASTYNPFYTHKQLTPDDAWLVNHGRNCRYFNYSAYDGNGRALIPDDVEIVDENNVIVSFIVPISGHCSFAFDQKHT